MWKIVTMLIKFHFYLLFLLQSLICVHGSITRDAPRISGGQPRDINRYPFATSLLSNFGAGSHWQACGGTIITQNAILSAASCFDSNGSEHPVLWWRARVGSSYSNAGGLTHIVRLIVQHPSYQWATKANDLAILRTTLPFAYSQIVAPASLAGLGLALETHKPVTALGWGLISSRGDEGSELRDVEFWIVNRDTCRNRYRSIGFELDDNMLCAGWLDVGVRAQCEGDVGSPLLHEGHVIAVFSWSQGCAEGWFSGINTRTAPYNTWIVNTARQLL